MSPAFESHTAGQTAVRVVGSIFPADLLTRLLSGEGLDGLGGGEYHLELGVSPREAANRAWAVLSGAWSAYRDVLAKRPDDVPATSLTREKWELVLLRELGYGRVSPAPGGFEEDGRHFPVSHCWSNLVPMHLLGWRVPLDRSTKGLAGAAGRAPHSMVQELLNRSQPFSWALVTNGAQLRLLRDSTSLIGQSYVEFDLEAIFEGAVFADFALLYLLCHQSRLEPLSEENRADCWLERWRVAVAAQGMRVLGDLRDGVKEALEALGSGFANHPANAALYADLERGALNLDDYRRSLLRVVYRLLFCFVAEDRGLLLLPDDGSLDATGREERRAAQTRYRDWFSTARLRRIVRRNRGGRHHDQWRALQIVLNGLGSEGGLPELALPGLGGIFESGPSDVVRDCELSNQYLYTAIRHLSFTVDQRTGTYRPIDYANLGAEELGGIYEGLLEFVPVWNSSTRSFSLKSLAGNERRTSGAYYTPSSLTDCLLDTALDPLLDKAERADDPEAALLNLTVCDPACGSGHFLVAAARRIAARLAGVRAGGDEPTVLLSQAAMHDVVARCIYGVDISEMAAELAKMGLWLEALQPGRPLSHLDSHIKVGNSLLGVTPALLNDGIPSEAFTPLEGDDKRVVSSLKKRNSQERAGYDNLFTSAGWRIDTSVLSQEAHSIDALPALSLADIHLAAQRQSALQESPELTHALFLADAWCTAFLVEKRMGSPEITDEVLRSWSNERPGTALSDEKARQAVKDVAAAYRLFHWHLEFPQIFEPDASAPGPGWRGGFSLVIGNPPWERIKLQEQEYFASRDDAVAKAPTAAARKKLIRELEVSRPELYAEYLVAKRQSEGESHLLRNSGRYPLCGRGDINTYAVFAEHFRALVAPSGRVGIIVPTGIATDATTQFFFRDVVESQSLVSLYDFENRLPLFEDVDSRFKFVLLTMSGQAATVTEATFVFFAHDPADVPARQFQISPEELLLVNPNTGTCPVFRSRRDAEITLAAYRRHPVLVRHGEEPANPWGVLFSTMFHMSNDSHLFHTQRQLLENGWTLEGNVFRQGDDIMRPLYEGKMIHHYDHRWATFEIDESSRDVTPEEHADPMFQVIPRYWVAESEVKAQLPPEHDKPWLLGFRNTSNATNARTFITDLFPISPVGNNMPCIFTNGNEHLLTALLSSFCVDFVVRQKLGGTAMNFFYVEQLPVAPPEIFAEACAWDVGLRLDQWFEDRLVELFHTSVETASFAREIGRRGAPFVWNPERRAQLRAELDAAVFQLYGFPRDDVDYILGTFPIVNRKDVDAFGEERTRRLVLEAFDGLAHAIDTGMPYVSPLVPPPGDGLRWGGAAFVSALSQLTMENKENS